MPETGWLPSGNQRVKGKPLFRFGISNAFRRKGIAFFAILGTALGIALMTVLLSISAGMNTMIDDMKEDMSTSIAVYPADDPLGFMIPSSIGMPISYADEIRNIEVENERAVSRVIPEVNYFVRTAEYDFGDPMGVILFGVDLEGDMEPDDPWNPDHILPGGQPLTPLSRNEVIIGKNAHNAATGDYAQVGGTMNLTVRGTYNEGISVIVVGIIETGTNFYDFSVFTDINTARSLMPKVVEFYPDGVNFMAVDTADVFYVDNVANTIVELFKNEPVKVSTTGVVDLLESFEEMMGTMESFLWIISLVAAIAGGVSIFIVMLISVIERIKEFGILKASGWSNRNIITSVVVQSITIGLLGALVGLAIGYGGGKGIDSYAGVDIAIITWELAVGICAFGILVGVVGGLYPALRAARVSPIESLRAL